MGDARPGLQLDGRAQTEAALTGGKVSVVITMVPLLQRTSPGRFLSHQRANVATSAQALCCFAGALLFSAHVAQRLGSPGDRSADGIRRRLGMRAYLPQGRRRWHPAYSLRAVPRRYPLFPRYVLLPLGDAKPSLLRLVRGLRKLKPI